VHFQADPNSPIFPELKNLVAKTSGVGDALRSALSPLERDIKVAFIYGSIARGEQKQRSDVDLLIVGSVPFSEVAANLEHGQKVIGREVNPTVYSTAEFRARMRETNHFLTSVLNGPKIFLLGDEDALGRLAQKRLAHRPRN